MHGATDAYVMMEVLVGGQCDPRALARLAKGRARTKTAQLEEALREFFTEHHAAVLRMMLDNTDRISAQIAALDARIEEQIGPSRPRRPGWLRSRCRHRGRCRADRRDRGRNDRVPVGRAFGVVGQVLPADSPVGRQVQPDLAHVPRFGVVAAV